MKSVLHIYFADVRGITVALLDAIGMMDLSTSCGPFAHHDDQLISFVRQRPCIKVPLTELGRRSSQLRLDQSHFYPS